jgi:hypothetical protein
MKQAHSEACLSEDFSMWVFEKSPNRGQWKAQAPPRAAAGSRGPSVRLTVAVSFACYHHVITHMLFLN